MKGMYSYPRFADNTCTIVPGTGSTYVQIQCTSDTAGQAMVCQDASCATECTAWTPFSSSMCITGGADSTASAIIDCTRDTSSAMGYTLGAGVAFAAIAGVAGGMA